MQPLYTSTALALMLALGGTAQAAGTESQGQSGAQQAAQSQQQQPKQPQSGQQQAAQSGQTQQQAQGQQQGSGPLRTVDTDGDGQISAQEAQAHRKRTFSSLDANDDSKLSRWETGGLVAIEPGYVVVTRMIPVAVTADLGAHMFSQMDQDQNKQISRQEYMQYGEQQFEKAQEHAGGKLATARAETGQGQTGQAQSQTRASQGQSGQAQSQAQSGQGQAPEWQQVVRWREADADRNGDGVVSADEAANAWVDTFHRLDRNGDDQLTQDELKQIQAQKAMIDRRFAKLDANGDGQVGPDEYSSAGHDLMQLADLNQDGNVTAWEYRAVRVTDR